MSNEEQPNLPASPPPVPPSLPAAETVAPTPVQPKHPRGNHGKLWSLVCLITILVFFAGGYWLGNKQGYDSGKKAMQSQMTHAELQVPAGATIVSQCEPGEGTQYVMPKDIPNGPVYNVWQNKVIGLEFMVGRDELLTQGKNYANLPMMGSKFDHMNIGFVSHGHAGFPLPHYHIELYTIPASQESQITCGGATPNDTTHMNMHM